MEWGYWGTRRPDGGHPVLGLRVRGTAGPTTTSPGGQLVLGPRVRGTAGPRRLGPHVRGGSWSSDNGFFLPIIDNYFSDVIIIEVAAVSGW